VRGERVVASASARARRTEHERQGRAPDGELPVGRARSHHQGRAHLRRYRRRRHRAHPEAQRTIVALAQFHARTPRALDATPHVGLRGGGSRIGFCPLLHDGTSITANTVPGGVRLQLRADSPTRVKELQNFVSARAARLPSFPSS
jgi:hypothetical protein